MTINRLLNAHGITSISIAKQIHGQFVKLRRRSEDLGFDGTLSTVWKDIHRLSVLPDGRELALIIYVKLPDCDNKCADE